MASAPSKQAGTAGEKHQQRFLDANSVLTFIWQADQTRKQHIPNSFLRTMATQAHIAFLSVNSGLKFEISFFSTKKKAQCFLSLTLAKHTLISSLWSLLQLIWSRKVRWLHPEEGGGQKLTPCLLIEASPCRKPTHYPKQSWFQQEAPITSHDYRRQNNFSPGQLDFYLN